MKSKTQRRPLLLRALGLAAIATVVSSSHVTSQPAVDLPLVVYAAHQNEAGASVQVAAFRRGMEELGYVEGQNIRYEFRYADGNADLRAPVAAEVAALSPDVIVASPFMGAPVADATSTIPIVVGNVALQTLFDELISRTQTNITGTRPVLAGAGMSERVSLARELAPIGTKVGLLYEDTADGAPQRADAEAAASALGIPLVVSAVQSVDGITAAAQALVDQGVNVMVVASGGSISTGIDQMLEVARTARIPVIYSGLSLVLRGGLAALGYNNDLTFHAAADIVDQILKGANPAEIAWAEIEAAWLAVNTSAAAEIGFTFPPAVLERANQVIN